MSDHEVVADWDGQSYREVSALQMWVATRSLAGVAMAGDERVLDLGCGDGRITAAVAEQLPDGSILGIDPSPRMIAAAGMFSSPRLRFAVGDVLSMGFRDEFDVVVSFNALHWVPDQHAALTRIRAALHNGPGLWSRPSAPGRGRAWRRSPCAPAAGRRPGASTSPASGRRSCTWTRTGMPRWLPAPGSG